MWKDKLIKCSECVYFGVCVCCVQPLMTHFCCCWEKSDPTVLIKTNGTDHSPLIVSHWQMAPLTLEDCCRGPAWLQHTNLTNENYQYVYVCEPQPQSMPAYPHKCVPLCTLYLLCQSPLLCTRMCKVGNTATLGSVLAIKAFFYRQSPWHQDIVNK